jgi:CHAD domain-containing protein
VCEQAAFEVGSGWSEGAFAAALPPSLSLHATREQRVRRRHLDTFDWRLWSDGGSLVHESTPHGARLLWHATRGDAPVVVAAGEAPRSAAELPPVLRTALAASVAPRALLVQGDVALRRRVFALLDDADKTVVRVVMERGNALDAEGGVARRWRVLRVEELRGYGDEARAVIAALENAPGLKRTELDELEAAAISRGRRPGDYSSRMELRLDPEAPAVESLRAILARLLAVVEANVEGVVADLDTEFLHDLRVAVRRSRSALGQLAGALAPVSADRLRDELRVVAAATDECRDLDVLLLELAETAQTSEASAALAPLRSHLVEQRALAHAQLKALLGSPRFRRLIASWRALVARRRLTRGPDGGRPTAQVAGERLWRAYRRFIKHAQALPAEPAIEAMHRLRIDAKKLRYLLEFFASLLPQPAASGVVRTLKGVQDELGAFHDLHLYAARVRDAASQIDAGPRTTEALLAIGALAGEFERRTPGHLERFHARLPELDSREVRAVLRALRRGRN